MDQFEDVFEDMFGKTEKLNSSAENHETSGGDPVTIGELISDKSAVPNPVFSAAEQFDEHDAPAGSEAEETPSIVVSEEVEAEQSTMEESNLYPTSEDVIPISSALLPEEKEMLSLISEEVVELSTFAEKISAEVREMHKLYHNEYAGRLRTLQGELDQYRERDKGRVYDGILSELARLYSENETLVGRIEDPKAQKQLRFLFMDILQLLESYGVSRYKSEAGEKRSPRYCQVIERIKTEDPDKHDTVARSINTGFYIENRPIVKEQVAVYLFSANTGDTDAAPENRTGPQECGTNASEA